MHLKKIIFIVGSTAVGKTSLAIDLAGRINGEIVSCDSMQIYKEISIASAKPSNEQMQGIPHHLVDILSVGEDFDVSQFNDLANRAISDILLRERIPVVVGGSGMYVQILLDGIFEGGQKNGEVRKKLQERIEQEGNEAVYDELRKVDPKAAAKIHPNDARRIVRALEIYQVTGKPISSLQKERKGLYDSHEILFFGLERPRQDLYEVIDRRVEMMFSSGVIDEISQLRNKTLSKTAEQIIGVKEIKGLLNNEYDQDQAQNLMQRNTRHFAKRQMTWFKSDDRIQWLILNEEEGMTPVIERIMQVI
ncbi:MAG: tRNA (adenosine(37)-N6)-dimethylallyltransferase MiaA [Candidatus Omnitrophica bacterium]|nr:tRNA (adenosine(37)-N6)-dimethylallyltransferase MiaA [Candidatus Omnitrophota bacterium]